jgi:hypothetical protein
MVELGAMLAEQILAGVAERIQKRVPLRLLQGAATIAATPWDGLPAAKTDVFVGRFNPLRLDRHCSRSLRAVVAGSGSGNGMSNDGPGEGGSSTGTAARFAMPPDSNRGMVVAPHRWAFGYFQIEKQWASAGLDRSANAKTERITSTPSAVSSRAAP